MNTKLDSIETAAASAELSTSELRAKSRAEHEARLHRYRTELEAKREELAALESLPHEPPRFLRRLLEWSVPVAATALVTMFSFAMLGEPEAEAHSPDTIVEVEPEYLAYPATDYAIPAATPTPEPPAAVTPEPKAKPKPKAKSKAKPKAKSKAKPKAKSETDKKSPVKKRNNPLILGSDNGNPLG